MSITFDSLQRLIETALGRKVTLLRLQNSTDIVIRFQEHAACKACGTRLAELVDECQRCGCPIKVTD